MSVLGMLYRYDATLCFTRGDTMLPISDADVGRKNADALLITVG
jgi:hypothetical protein